MKNLKFLIDENLGFFLAKWLQEKGYDTRAVILTMGSATDEQVLNTAFVEDRILITSDKDFGEMVFAKKLQHCGIILLRLKLESKLHKINVLNNLLEHYSDQLIYNYIVATDTQVKIKKQINWS